LSDMAKQQRKRSWISILLYSWLGLSLVQCSGSLLYAQFNPQRDPRQPKPTEMFNAMTSMVSESGSYSYQCPAKPVVKSVAKPAAKSATKSVAKPIAPSTAKPTSPVAKPASPAMPPDARTIAAVFETPSAATIAGQGLAGMPHKQLDQLLLVAVAPDQAADTAAKLQAQGALKVLTSNPDQIQAQAFNLNAIVPQPKAAKHLNQQFKQYFDAPSEAYLQAPWADRTTTPAQQKTIAKARYTYGQLEERTRELASRTMMAENNFGKQFLGTFWAAITRDRRAAAEVGQNMARQHQAAVTQASEELLAMKSDQIDRPTIQLYQALWQEQLSLSQDYEAAAAQGKFSDEQMARVHQRIVALGQRLGQVELGPDGKPTAQALQWSAEGSSGSIAPDNAPPSLRLLRFQNTFQGLPAATQYLCDHGATAINYDMLNLSGVEIND
jgi:hypothetical protein